MRAADTSFSQTSPTLDNAIRSFVTRLAEARRFDKAVHTNANKEAAKATKEAKKEKKQNDASQAAHNARPEASSSTDIQARVVSFLIVFLDLCIYPS